jgi:8-hydroxy-5-deazaflavin:NADPH oxidoreductase
MDLTLDEHPQSEEEVQLKRPLLVGMLGFEPVDAGPLKNARLLEPFAMVWIDQAMKRGRGRDFAFALVKMK